MSKRTQKRYNRPQQEMNRRLLPTRQVRKDVVIARRQNMNSIRRRSGANAPIAISVKDKFQPVKMYQLDKQSIQVQHREFIRPVTTTGDAQWLVQPPINLNPGLEIVFPWLSKLAAGYETYTIRRCAVEYRPHVPTTTSGQVAMLIDYDASDDPIVTELDFKNMQGMVMGSTWEPISLVSNAEQLSKIRKRYVRTEELKTNLDVKLYDWGKLYFATAAAPLNTPIGDLYITYTIEFQTPQSNKAPPIAGGGFQQLISNESSILRPWQTAVSTGDNFFKPVPGGDNSKLECLRSGDYMFDITGTGTTLANIDFNPPLTDIGNRLLVGILNAGVTSIVNNVIVRLKAGQLFSTIFGGTTLTKASAYITRVSPEQAENILADTVHYPIQ